MTLLEAATAVRLRAYVPYSRFHVGAAIMSVEGRVHIGCNVENVAYPEGTCAEAGAIAAMIAAGDTRIAEMVVIADIGKEVEHLGAFPLPIEVIPFGEVPSTRHIRGSNFCHIGVAADRIEGRAIVTAALDNLTKGSSGQALQNANLMLGIEETEGLMMAPLFP